MTDSSPRSEVGSEPTVGVRSLRAELATHLSRVEAGETVVIRRGGRPVARLVPISAQSPVQFDLEEMARIGFVRRPLAQSSVAPDIGGAAPSPPLPVDVRVDRIVRQVRG